MTHEQPSRENFSYKPTWQGKLENIARDSQIVEIGSGDESAIIRRIETERADWNIEFRNSETSDVIEEQYELKNGQGIVRAEIWGRFNVPNTAGLNYASRLPKYSNGSNYNINYDVSSLPLQELADLALRAGMVVDRLDKMVSRAEYVVGYVTIRPPFQY